ncbi:hypothetical protein CONLIGDRAFT_638320 [Coniochaeta ligniaria NRRL 30616]|uniref:Uncharacterized protein n=1 Tax=Coniochaeta ligniaria NRRL 30616 TaxID=1408157 RepID=A0A1J7IXW3_9PEZI|nr:hypothetical protein CONLIGDRAFT_638320 [Coniochaeta ligniaria NRRL 30616]
MMLTGVPCLEGYLDRYMLWLISTCGQPIHHRGTVTHRRPPSPDHPVQCTEKTSIDMVLLLIISAG